jgi:pyruvate/2-oxoglutarate dehydrogenase complex dihydrolipoamide acyltransferase (E2) component
MNTAAKKELRMRRLSPGEIGDYRLDIMSALARSCDPTAGVVYPLDMEPCLALAREASARLERKITFATVLNKLVATAIDENPAFNQVVLGRSVYQLEGIHLSNAFMLPGKEQVLTYIIFDNPHHKTLAEIQQEAIMKMVEKTREHARPKSRLARALPRLYFRLGINRLVSEQFSFAVAFKNGIVSNIILSNHDYGGPAGFFAVKPIISVIKGGLRIHACGMGRQPFIDESGAVMSRETLYLTVIGDHRITSGNDAYRLGQSLRRLCATPEKYLL